MGAYCAFSQFFYEDEIKKQSVNCNSKKQFLRYFPETKCDDDAGHIHPPSIYCNLTKETFSFV